MHTLSKMDRLALRLVQLTHVTRKIHPALVYAAVTFLIIGTEMVRVWWLGGLPKELPTNQYMPFYIIVLLSALCFDRFSGIYATVLSSIVSASIKGPIPGSIELKIDVGPTVGFMVTGLMMAITIESLNHLYARHKKLADRNEVLIRDLNHRVKNHLAAIAGLVNLSRQNPEATKDDVLSSVSSRLMVLARLYDRLKLDSDNATVQVQATEFIPAICNELTHLVGDRLIEVDSQVDPAFITTDKAVPVGLLVNELVTNCLKHAFPGGQGHVTVSLLKQADGYELKVCDNGVGGERGKSNTGSKLVQILVKQLDGKLDISYDAGRCTTITLPESLTSTRQRTEDLQ
jgi:two-component sensor histidine kinase